MGISLTKQAWTVVGLLTLFIALARSWLLFREPYLPGTNGAYYLVQARSLLERGALAIPDLPLTFFLHASVARFSQWFGLPANDAILFAVKWCDAVFPALLAIPVFALVYRWSDTHNFWISSIAALLACIGLPALLLMGDFQKNALALVWFALFLCALHTTLQNGNTKQAVAPGIWLLFIGLTHLAVFGWAVLVLVVTLGIYQLRSDLRRVPSVSIFMGSLVLGIGFSLLALAFTDPGRGMRLAEISANPASFFAHVNTDGSSNALPTGAVDMPDVAQWLHAPIQSIMQMTSAVLYSEWAVPRFLAFAALAALIMRWRRPVLPPATTSLISGLALSVFALTGPWIYVSYLPRFYLIAAVPAILCLAFVAVQARARWLKVAVMGMGICVFLIPSLPRFYYGNAAFPPGMANEIKTLSPLIDEPENTLIATRHGLEWWAAWFLRTRVSQTTSLREEDWERYDKVLFLYKKSPKEPVRGSMPSHIGKPGPFYQPPLPLDAPILHDGPYFLLAEIKTAPAFTKASPP